MIVLDASALVDVVLDRAAKTRLVGHLDDELCAPSHQPAEALSAIARLVRAEAVEPDVAATALAEVAALEQELVTPTGEHLHGALDLQSRVRVLDGLYVLLAAERGCPLLTTDGRLARADPPCEVIFVG